MENKMETTEDKKVTDNRPEWGGHRSGRIFGGVVVMVVGGLLLARQVGADIPEWIFTWPSLLIVLGLYVGARHSFKSFGWLIPIAIGAFLLSKEHIDVDIWRYFWPVVIILIGIGIMFKPHHRHRRQRWNEERWKRRWERQYSHYHEGKPIEGDTIDSVSIFGGTKKNVISKDFKGGESVCMFGGLELNMSQADINGRVNLEVVQVFGGTKLVVPPHWKIQADELVTVFGSIEDKRHIQPGMVYDETKVLVLEGTCVFGGIEIRSF